MDHAVPGNGSPGEGRGTGEEGRSIIHLEVGEPDFRTPKVIREAGIKAILDGHTRYTHSQGRPS